MPEDQIAALIDSPSVREAVAVVLEQTGDRDDELQWADVRGSLTTGQWGRLIESGILVSGTSGFVVANRDRARRVLNQPSEATDTATTAADPVTADEGDAASWAWYDKAAGVTALVFFVGYWNTGIRDVIASFDNVVLGPVTDVLPFYVVVLVLAVITGTYATLIQANLMDTEKMQVYQDRMKRLKERREDAKEQGDEETLERVQEEQLYAASDQLGMFKLQFRPMVWIMLLTIPVFLWLRWKVRGGHLAVGQTGLVVPIAGAVSWQQPLVGPMRTWIIWYFLCSVASRQVVQKALDLQIARA